MTSETLTPAATLYERLGGGERLRAMIGEVVDAHLANPNIQARFVPHDPAVMKEMAFTFFAMATGGPEAYTGRGLRAVHTGMNVGEAEFVYAVDDVVAVLQKNGVGEREQAEVLAAFFALKGEVLHL